MRFFQHALVKRLALVFGLWILFVVVPSVPFLRAWLVSPLVVTSPDAQGDAAYVMAGGSNTMRERLRMAADLYHLHKINTIYLLAEQQDAGFNFVTQRKETRFESNSRYLQFWGVPPEAIRSLPEKPEYLFSSLSEAASMSEHLPADVRKLVVVTSAPHTRRCLICFQRKLPASVSLEMCSATPAIASAELYFPIWQEYAKLIAYYLAP